MDRSTIEQALDAGRVEAQMGNGRWWKVRRNGRTKTWKREPERFSIPVKAGLKSHGYIDNENMGSGLFRIT